MGGPPSTATLAPQAVENRGEVRRLCKTLTAADVQPRHELVAQARAAIHTGRYHIDAEAIARIILEICWGIVAQDA